MRTHMPGLELELDGFKSNYFVKTFIFRSADPRLIKGYTSASFRNVLDAVVDTNGCMAESDGRSLIITVPRKEKKIMRLGNGIEKLSQKPKNGDLSCYIGERADGEDEIIDLNEVTHMLIAGQTGFGKSICIHDILLTLMSRYTKDECVFYLMDSKSDLTRYAGIPSVIRAESSVAGIASALESVISEMAIRQKEMESMSISDWNLKYPDKAKPHIVAVFDDIDNVIGRGASKKLDEGIRASMSKIVQERSLGVHLILALQRPIKVNIDTSVKSQIRARIAFRLGSSPDSIIMLNTGGAEKLTGIGDAYVTTGGKPERVQVAYVSWDEIEAAINELKNGAAEPQEDPETD